MNFAVVVGICLDFRIHVYRVRSWGYEKEPL